MVCASFLRVDGLPVYECRCLSIGASLSVAGGRFAGGGAFGGGGAFEGGGAFAALGAAGASLDLGCGCFTGAAFLVSSAMVFERLQLTPLARRNSASGSKSVSPEMMWIVASGS